MMRTCCAVSLLIVIVALPLGAAAQGGAQGGDSTKVKEKTTYDFEGDDVTGNLVKPNESNIQAQQHGKTSSLITIRSDFIPEMLKTVEDL
jgi:hypothetical protein